MATAAQSFTIQLNSASSEKLHKEHYVRTLEPAIGVPYLAKPRAQLEHLAFANSFSNVNSGILKNGVLKLAYKTYDLGATTETWHNVTLTLDDGYFTLPSLEAAIADKLYATHEKSNTIGSNLWDTMNHMSTANAGYTIADPTDEPGKQTVSVKSDAMLFTTASGDFHFPGVDAGTVIIPVRLASVDLGRLTKAGVAAAAITKPPLWLVGGKVTTVIPTAGGETLDKYAWPAGGPTVVNVVPLPSTAKAFYYGDDVEKTVTGDWGLQLSAPGNITESAIWLAADDGNGGVTTVGVAPPGSSDPSYRGYSVAGLATASLAASSGWGESLLPQEMELIAKTTAIAANNIVVGGAKDQETRSVRPFSFGVDNVTNQLTFVPAWPGVYVCKGSTLMTDMLGFEDDELASETPTDADIAAQNPFAVLTGGAVALGKAADRTMFRSTQEIQVSRTRALQFHCPTLCQTLETAADPNVVPRSHWQVSAVTRSSRSRPAYEVTSGSI